MYIVELVYNISIFVTYTQICIRMHTSSRSQTKQPYQYKSNGYAECFAAARHHIELMLHPTASAKSINRNMQIDCIDAEIIWYIWCHPLGLQCWCRVKICDSIILSKLSIRIESRTARRRRNRSENPVVGFEKTLDPWEVSIFITQSPTSMPLCCVSWWAWMTNHS